jgi:hypothetical protein
LDLLFCSVTVWENTGLVVVSVVICGATNSQFFADKLKAPLDGALGFNLVLL